MRVVERVLEPGRWLAATRRYLSPEPLLQDPDYVRDMASSGLSVPTYAYALNNPIRYVDSNGLDPVAGAAAGAEAGSFAGPAGAAIGAAVGAVVGTAAAAAVTATIVNAPINWAGTEPGAGVPDPPGLSAAPMPQPDSEPGCTVVPMGKGGGKGERGRTAKATGTANPWKHCRPHPTDPTKIICKDANGKWPVKQKPPGFDEWWNSR